MIPVPQEFRHNPARGVQGDCHRAALASLFELPLSEVPHFASDAPSADRFNLRVAYWLAERNLTSVTLPFSGSLQTVLRGMAQACPNGYWLLACSARHGGNHLVVCYGGAVVHDPGVGTMGIGGPCSDGFFWATFLTPRDPTVCRFQLGWPRPVRESLFTRFLRSIGVLIAVDDQTRTSP